MSAGEARRHVVGFLDLFIDIFLEVQNRRYSQIPQTDLSVGVLTVLVKGPWLVACSVDAASDSQTLLFHTLRDPTLKNTM